MPTRKKRGGSIKHWLWGVTDVSVDKPLKTRGLDDSNNHTQKGGKKSKKGGKKNRKGGFSAQLVPIGLTLANLFLGTKKKRRYPKKGMPSRSRKGRLDFITHKGNKFYNRKSKRQNRNSLGVKKRPY